MISSSRGSPNPTEVRFFSLEPNAHNMTTTNDKLDYLLGEVTDLQARVVGLSAVVGALVATHTDPAGLHDYLMKMRGSMKIGSPEPIVSQEQLDVARSIVDWIDRDLPAAG